MKQFQLIFQNGLVRTLSADKWRRDGSKIIFSAQESVVEELEARTLLMIDEVEVRDSQGSRETGESP